MRYFSWVAPPGRCRIHCEAMADLYAVLRASSKYYACALLAHIRKDRQTKGVGIKAISHDTAGRAMHQSTLESGTWLEDQFKMIIPQSYS